MDHLFLNANDVTSPFFIISDFIIGLLLLIEKIIYLLVIDFNVADFDIDPTCIFFEVE